MAVTCSGQNLEGQIVGCRGGEMEKEKKNRAKHGGVRVVHGRIYDSDNGKTCHQCRQKTRDFAAECKNMKGEKQCTIKYCQKCLLNRYGEKAEEVALLDNWTCPKCKGFCNCSFCMKKRGHKPTGILVRTAKENGFSSVSELLQIKGPENFGHDRIAKVSGTSSNKPASAKKSAISPPRKLGKENSFDNSDSHSQKLSSISSKKKTKREEVPKAESDTRVHDSLGEDGKKKHGLAEDISKINAKVDGQDDGSSAKKNKCKGLSEIILNEVKKNEKDEDVIVVEKKSKKQSQDVLRKELVNNGRAEPKEILDTQMSRDVVCLAENEKRDVGDCTNLSISSSVECKIFRHAIEPRRKQVEEDISLPSGTCLTNVAGIELPHEDAGHALQFIEFCSAFGEVLDIKKGQAEAVVREIIFGRRGRRSQGSLLVQFQIKLLSLILEDMGEKSSVLTSANGQTSWLKALWKFVSDSKFMSKEFPSDCFDRGNERYDMFSTSQKFTLLNFLIDEALNTNDLRNWIDDQNSKFVEKEKEAKEKVLAAKCKEKILKQKMQDEVVKAINAKNGAPFFISEHEAIVSRIKKEAAQAHSEVLSAMGMVPKKRQRSDAVRTDPLLVDVNGHAFWRLKGCSGESDILLQDMSNWSLLASEEKWFVYDVDKKRVVEKYISLRSKRLKAPNVEEIPSYEHVEPNS